MNVYNDYKYPINEIASARINKNHNELKFYTKEYKRLNQGLVTKIGMWHTAEEETDGFAMLGFVAYKDCQKESMYQSKKDKRKSK